MQLYLFFCHRLVPCHLTFHSSRPHRKIEVEYCTNTKVRWVNGRLERKERKRLPNTGATNVFYFKTVTIDKRFNPVPTRMAQAFSSRRRVCVCHNTSFNIWINANHIYPVVGPINDTTSVRTVPRILPGASGGFPFKINHFHSLTVSAIR